MALLGAAASASVAWLGAGGADGSTDGSASACAGSTAAGSSSMTRSMPVWVSLMSWFRVARNSLASAWPS